MARITVHRLADSCVRIEVDDHSALVDPGFYPWEHDGLDLASMPAPDRLLITHNHPDHLSLEFVRALLDAYPKMVIETNDEVVAMLGEEGISATSESATWTSQFTAPHQPTSTGSQPQNVGFLVAGVFAHVGDSYTSTRHQLSSRCRFCPPGGQLPKP